MNFYLIGEILVKFAYSECLLLFFYFLSCGAGGAVRGGDAGGGGKVNPCISMNGR